MIYKVAITETLQRVVAVEAENPEEAEHIASYHWRNSEYILGAEDFSEVEFTVVQNEYKEIEKC